MKKKLYLPMINLTPTMRCNLKCQLCGVLVPQYSCRPEMSLEQISSELKAVFEIVDQIDKLQVTGGEPLLHPRLDSILEECFCYKSQFDKLWIFTNCTVSLKPQVESILLKYKERIVIHASDYGINQKVTKEFIQRLDDSGIPYRYLKYYGEEQYAGGWVDQGDFIAHNRSEKERKEVFRSCSHVNRGGSWYVRNGQMHWCGRSIRGMEVGRIPDQKEDYLDIYSGSVEERREKLETLMQAEQILACNYCNGDYGTCDMAKRHPAGEQVRSC